MAIIRRKFKRYKRRFPPTRATRFMSSAGKGIYLASKALAVAQGVRSIINSEKKTYDTNPFSAAISATGSIIEVSGMAQGDDYANREGRSILVKSLEFRGVVVRNLSSTTATDVIRVMVVQDSNADGSDPTVTEVLTTASYWALRNADPINMKRFKILWDKTIFVDDAKSLSAKVQGYIKLNHHIKYAGTGASTSNQGSMWILAISNTSTNSPTLNLYSRLRFYDN